MSKSLLCTALFLAVFISAPLFAGGGTEEPPQEFDIPIPQVPDSPQLPSVLRNEDDFSLVLTAYDDLLLFVEPLVDSLIFNGIEANEVPLAGIQDLTTWWRNYLRRLKIEADGPDVRTGEIDEFLGGLIIRDEQFQAQLDELNRIIELENEEIADS